MASIVKRKKKYSVVYTYTDENGNKRQKWETFDTNAEAKKRKLQPVAAMVSTVKIGSAFSGTALPEGKSHTSPS